MCQDFIFSSLLVLLHLVFTICWAWSHIFIASEVSAVSLCTLVIHIALSGCYSYQCSIQFIFLPDDFVYCGCSERLRLFSALYLMILPTPHQGYHLGGDCKPKVSYGTMSLSFHVVDSAQPVSSQPTISLPPISLPPLSMFDFSIGINSSLHALSLPSSEFTFSVSLLPKNPSICVCEYEHSPQQHEGNLDNPSLQSCMHSSIDARTDPECNFPPKPISQSHIDNVIH
ncbi:hypothetical protein GYMLUDRAFT_63275 [Collybiopsis luxurians FD-317 M1]|uniref:Uncharacterized protein n=1 Tax=Collybiopsis luxurians FD-317 M1 TaxID=944289 RepID=A0A0D0BHR8_9AGAR|nr:hypothetical protein GYMLUDRAFT_63275 [Collybiopsis luxurians FD-317 M1]